jgi:hypothetical protein
MESAAAASEPQRPTAEVTGLQQEVATVVAATTATTAVSEIPPAPVPDDDDAPPPRWGQWESWPAPAPEPAAGVLVMREDGCMMPRRPMHGGPPGAGAGARESAAGPL